MDGHASTIGGCIVDSGKFDWLAHKEKYPGLTTPDDSYHGIVYAEKFGKEGAYITKATAQLMRDFGCTQSPQSAYYINLGLESLHVRMPKHNENALKVAEFLKNDDRVEWVIFPGLKGDKYYDLAQKYMPNGTCGVVSFGVKGGRKAAETFMKNLKLAAIETHVADARTCCLHPANATHRQLSDEQLKQAGISPELIRFSCGIEGAEDLINDIKQALDKI
jgi:O-acetylhomoserine (thiol)-lyase